MLLKIINILGWHLVLHSCNIYIIAFNIAVVDFGCCCYACVKCVSIMTLNIVLGDIVFKIN